ncbi:MAG: gas vesicle protein GvpD [Nanoarchaeota archaeon]|nr:gas vesicle protein GvpD [Nanoarchaeota archaeon]
MNLKSRGEKFIVRSKDKKSSSRSQKQILRKTNSESVKKLSVNKIQGKSKILKKLLTDGYIHTGISGLDELFEKGIPKWASVLVAGGPGSGKTILCLQILANAAAHGERCLYISFEESEKRLLEHMKNFGLSGEELIKKGKLKIVRKDPFVLASSVEALLADVRGELLIDVEEVLEIIPPGFKPDRIVFDSISTIATILPPKEEGYRVFIEQLFRYLESLDVTSFLISETEQVPVKYSDSGVEEFLADGVIALYNYRKQNVRVSALEIIKMRGAKIEKKLVPFEIKGGKGIVVYPEAMVFEEF